MPPVLRAARPTDAEAALFAELTDAAARGMFAYLLGRDAPRILAAIYKVPGHTLSFERVVVAESDGAVAGMASDYSAEDYRAGGRIGVRLMTREAGWRALRLGIAYVPVRRPLGFTEQIDDGDQYLQMVAVLPAFRGRGVGTALIEAAAERARSEGASRLVLDVEAENSGALALYRRLGFEITATSRRGSWPMRHIQIHRMGRTL